MNPYSDPDEKAKILAMQLAVNAASQAAWAAEKASSPDAVELRQTYRDLNQELQAYIEELRRK